MGKIIQITTLFSVSVKITLRILVPWTRVCVERQIGLEFLCAVLSEKTPIYCISVPVPILEGQG